MELVDEMVSGKLKTPYSVDGAVLMAGRSTRTAMRRRSGGRSRWRRCARGGRQRARGATVRSTSWTGSRNAEGRLPSAHVRWSRLARDSRSGARTQRSWTVWKPPVLGRRLSARASTTPRALQTRARLPPPPARTRTIPIDPPCGTLSSTASRLGAAPKKKSSVSTDTWTHVFPFISTCRVFCSSSFPRRVFPPLACLPAFLLLPRMNYDTCNASV
ncbi:hypothetical protein DFH08DRAFT_100373 [Mycena albidolilacea]|uniref:Uncharacterized protein n=1 Tax=Mycena albidolilacea TaxID=1033008 RepID=A0AAD7A8U9_9AGAR|nr:hypothetical protein DFH08DRAFT_100373 [Mycena albidolilacea]